jgi:hypothetical protein
VPPQVSKELFSEALRELGHKPEEYQGKKLSLNGMSDLYGLNQDSILDAIDGRHIAAHYDYQNDTIWIDALDAAHFYFCVVSETGMQAWAE